MQFETLLFSISSRYINLPFDQIDRCIEDDQRRICQWFDIDLSSLWQWEDVSKKYMVLSHYYTKAGGPDNPGRIEARKVVPWVLEKVEQGKPFILVTKDMGDDARLDQEFRNFFGVKSSVIVPLTVGKKVPHGAISFDALWSDREWSEITFRRLIMIAQIFSSALARKTSEINLRVNEERLRLAAESSDAGFWEYELATDKVWTSKKVLDFFGNPSIKFDTLHNIKQLIHPDDLPVIEQAIKRALQKQIDFKAEYRIKVGEETYRWLYSIGKPFYELNDDSGKLLGISIDITRQKELENELKVSKWRLSSAVEVAELGFYEMAGDNSVTFIDKRMLELLGLEQGSTDYNLRQFWLDHIHQEDLPALLEKMERYEKDGADLKVFEYRYQNPLHGTLFIHHLSSVIQRDDAGKPTLTIGVAQDVTEQKLLEEKLIENQQLILHQKNELHCLTGRLISAQEEELRRLSRELHDDLTQRLALLAIEAGKLEMQMATMDSDLEGDLTYGIVKVKEQLIGISEDVHRLSRQLHPTIITEFGLVHAIQAELDIYTQLNTTVVDFHHQNIPDKINEEIGLCIFRIIQEALKNITSHSKAMNCDICLVLQNQIFELTINDNGIGFDPGGMNFTPGIGISSMRERVQYVHGIFLLESKKNQGTSIKVSIPNI